MSAVCKVSCTAAVAWLNGYRMSLREKPRIYMSNLEIFNLLLHYNFILCFEIREICI